MGSLARWGCIVARWLSLNKMSGLVYVLTHDGGPRLKYSIVTS